MAPRTLVDDGIRREDLTEERIAKWIRETGMRELVHFLSFEERETSRTAALARLPAGEDLWVFGYGSLMWNPAMHTAERRAGLIHGWHRTFCLWVPGGRGSPENPGLMLGLDRGGSCRGIVWRIAADGIASETVILWRREMIGDGYRPRWAKVATEQGDVTAITFVANTDHPRYARDLSTEKLVRTLATAEGRLGRSRDYLHNTVLHLDELGIADGPMHRLLTQVDAYDGG